MSETRSWYEIRAAANGATDIYLYDAIGGFGVSANAFLDALLSVNSKVINLHINSPGGTVDDGTAVYNSLKEHPATVNVTVDGLAASIASVIAQAGDTRKMAAGSMMMIHDPYVGINAIVLGNARDMRDLASEAEKQAVYLDKLSENVAEIYASRAGNSDTDWRGLMQAETWLRPREAVDLGLADVVVPSKAKNLAPAFNLAAFPYHNVPDWVPTAADPLQIDPPKAQKPSLEAQKWPLLVHHDASGALDSQRLAIALRRAYDLNVPINKREEAIAHLRAHGLERAT